MDECDVAFCFPFQFVHDMTDASVQAARTINVQNCLKACYFNEDNDRECKTFIFFIFVCNKGCC